MQVVCPDLRLVHACFSGEGEGGVVLAAAGLWYQLQMCQTHSLTRSVM